LVGLLNTEVSVIGQGDTGQLVVSPSPHDLFAFDVEKPLKIFEFAPDQSVDTAIRYHRR